MSPASLVLNGEVNPIVVRKFSEVQIVMLSIAKFSVLLVVLCQQYGIAGSGSGRRDDGKNGGT